MSTLAFDSNKFGDFMLGRGDISFSNKSSHGWNARDGQAMEYAGGGFDYRTWHHQVSVCRKSAAILVSCKIDQRRSDVHKDDHVVVLASVNRAGAVITVQAGAQSIHHNVTGTTPVIVHKDGVDTSVAFDEAVAKCITDMLGTTNDDGYLYMGKIAATNLQCLAASVVLR